MSDIAATSAASALQGLTSSASTDTSRLSSRENLEAAGQKFEAIFTGMMLKSMRATHLSDDVFGSKAQDTFRDMQDQQLVKSMASHAPIGIGKAMVDFLAKSQAALQTPTSQSDVNQTTAQPSP